MKLKWAHFKNFRLLKDLRLTFSANEEYPLTVIRAANETGKTTCLNGLIWCFYGDKALPNKGDYQLFPSDQMGGDDVKEKVEVTVEVEFETEHVRSVGRGKREATSHIYRIRRSCIEYNPSDSSITREGEVVTMVEVTPEGTKKKEGAEIEGIIEDALPESLKDVYFTDGDSAMSFIEAAAAQGVKRQRVHNAIESLLGVNKLKSTIRHLENVASKFSQEIDNRDYAAELERLNDQIAGAQEDIEEWDKEKRDLDEQVARFSKERDRIRKEKEEALKLGDKEQLVNDEKNANRTIERLQSNMDRELLGLGKLLYGDTVSRALAGEVLEKGKGQLNAMSEKKQLPKVNVPILEELLDREVCFCGSDLRAKNENGVERKESIRKAIEDSRESDEIQEAASQVFYKLRSEQFSGFEDEWIGEYGKLHEAFQFNAKQIQDEQERKARIREDIDSIDDSKLNELRELEQLYDEKLEKARGEQSTRSHQIEEKRVKLREAQEDREKVRKKLGKTDANTTKWDLARRAKGVFEEIFERLVTEELRKVSDEMNRIFLAMIGSDPEGTDYSLIRKACLTEEFDIVVYGREGHKLNPDQDLNGASRRAITLSFILALTKVSEVEAPNVIDTPLGMMTGYVKQSVLYNTLLEGSQVILFLTHDEIKGVENIIDTYAGEIFTLTNPAHFPKMLVNKPDVEESMVVRCECDHKTSCEVCQRKSLEVA